MLTLFGKKKLTDDQVANIFVNSVVNMVDDGFEEVVGFINESPEFIKNPNISLDNNGPFTLIVISGNLALLPEHFPPGHDKHIIELSLSKFASIYEMEKMEFAALINDTRKFMSRKNHPSKNVLYSMSKGLFCKYRLNDCQEEYFKSLDAPNPIFLKRLNEVMTNFLWDWRAFNEKYRIV